MVALMQLTHLFLPAMVERGWGRILNMSSVAAFVAGPEMSIYYASKAFVTSFSEAISEELKGTGVTVTALHPSPVATEFEKTADKALMRGKPLAYCSLFTKLVNLGARLAPRRVSRKLARRVNEIEED